MLAKAEHVAKTGSCEWNLETNEVIWSDELFRIFGLDPEQDRELMTVEPKSRSYYPRRL